MSKINARTHILSVRTGLMLYYLQSCLTDNVIISFSFVCAAECFNSLSFINAHLSVTLKGLQISGRYILNVRNIAMITSTKIAVIQQRG